MSQLLWRMRCRSTQPRRIRDVAALATWPTRLLDDRAGAVLVEYALVLSLLSFAFMAGMLLVEGATFNALTLVGSELTDYALRNGQ